MTLKRFALYGAATLTALTLASCGGDGGESSATTTTTTVAPASDQWGTPVKMSDWINSIGGTCDQFELVNDEIANCGNDSDGYYFLAQDSTRNPTAADGNRGAFMGGGHPMDAEMVWGDDWSIVCYGGTIVANCARVKNHLGMEYEARTVRASEDSVDETAEPATSPAPTMSASPSSVSSSSSGSAMDGIYADMLQDEGIDVTARDIARASTAVCDAFDGGAGQGEALGIVEETTGATGWQATRILQAGVLSRCSQYVDSTY